jgi:hypothetical protein
MVASAFGDVQVTGVFEGRDDESPGLVEPLGCQSLNPQAIF